ncbi:type II toxin-antitoxin system HigB family toxin [Chitinophagales bacterium]|nr:type II toxin-antitoxin system HigB family toxin [Chitinophagales bacterium]
MKVHKWQKVLRHFENDVIALKAFLDVKEKMDLAEWTKPTDIMKTFRTADLVVCSGKYFNRIVFDVGGNKFRMICGYRFSKFRTVLYIRFVGSHEEYDKVDVCEVDMFN